MSKLYCIAVKSEEQLDAEILKRVDYVMYCPGEYALKNVKRFLKQMGNGKWETANKVKTYLDLPIVAMSEDIKVLREILQDKDIRDGLTGGVANNVYALELAREYGLDVFKGMGMNTLNGNFCDFDNVILSQELYEGEYRLLKGWDKTHYFLCVYGRLPLMTLAHCPFKFNGYDCGNCNEVKLQYKDELCNIMNIRRVKINKCYFELLNAVPLNLLKYKNKIKPHFYFDMRETEKKEILKTLALFQEPGNKEPEWKHTAGWYFKDIK